MGYNPLVMEKPIYTKDDRSESFALLGDISATIAEVRGGVDVDDTTLNRWRNAMSLLREFDTLVDDDDISIQEALGLLKDFDYFKDRYPYLDKDNLPDESREVMVARVAYILALGEGISATKDPSEFYEYRTEEADHSALLLSDSATDYVKDQEGFDTKFIPMMQTLARTANYIDTITDYKQDKLDGKVEVENTRGLYCKLGRGALNGFATATPHLLHPRNVKSFATMSVMRAKNRIVHGRTPYSSFNTVDTSVVD